MKILVTNDDGIYSQGLYALAKNLKEIGDVYIIAPDRERSATGHAITLHHPLRIEKIKFFDTNIPAWSINGTPSDCVKLAVEDFLEQKPDMIFSGINRGPNLGTDVLYSGTVSAALEGSILGIPAIALSLTSYENNDYSYAGEFAKKIALKVKENNLPKSTILNINIPNLKKDEIKGVAITKLGIRKYQNSFIKRKDPRGQIYYWLAGEVIEENLDEDTDVGAVKNDMISITPIHLDLTDFKAIDVLKTWNLDNSRHYRYNTLNLKIKER